MPIGGPVASIGALVSGFKFNRTNAQSRVRDQLNESLRLLKEDREAKDAIAKEGVARDKAKAEFDFAQSELALIEQRRAQIMASPGKPFRDTALEGALEKAKDRMADAHAAVQERQDRLNGLMEDRDARIRSGLQSPKAPKFGDKTGGWFGTDVGSHAVTEDDRNKAIAARKGEIAKAEIADDETQEGKEFRQDYRSAEGELRRDVGLESKERADVAGAERSLEVGRAEQGPQNEETRNKELFPLDQESAKLRAKQVESQSAMAAAAQEIQNRQQQQAALQAEPGYQRALHGGAATGKGGGGGGLLGAIAGKSGGIGGQAPSMGPQAPSMGPQAQQSGSGPTVGQVAGPTIGKLLQMPLPQAAGLAKTLLGGQMGGSQGGPAQAQQVGQAPSGSNPTSGPGGAPKPPQRGNGGTQHFHFHQAPPSASAQETPARPATQQAGQSAPDFSAHPEVPASEAEKYQRPQQQKQQMGPEAMGMQTYGGDSKPLPPPAVGTIINGHRFNGGHPRDPASWPAVGPD